MITIFAAHIGQLFGYITTFSKCTAPRIIPPFFTLRKRRKLKSLLIAMHGRQGENNEQRRSSRNSSETCRRDRSRWDLYFDSMQCGVAVDMSFLFQKLLLCCQTPGSRWKSYLFFVLTASQLVYYTATSLSPHTLFLSSNLDAL